ncbi:MAG: hypothetical protein UY50_C0044G0007 [Parcubacteria group bacterium GW2011_GWA2_49_9]|nr:MAG: hypothetical protein UY50_C0044G0007 [Parcubacteria group bacterium GW2011_GWA2_49_9]
MLSHLKKPSTLIGITVLALLIAAYFFTLGRKPAEGETATVKRGDMIHTSMSLHLFGLPLAKDPKRNADSMGKLSALRI